MIYSMLTTSISKSRSVWCFPSCVSRQKILSGDTLSISDDDISFLKRGRELAFRSTSLFWCRTLGGCDPFHIFFLLFRFILLRVNNSQSAIKLNGVGTTLRQRRVAFKERFSRNRLGKYRLLLRISLLSMCVYTLLICKWDWIWENVLVQRWRWVLKDDFKNAIFMQKACFNK